MAAGLYVVCIYTYSVITQDSRLVIYWLITKYTVPGNYEKWPSQKAEAKITESQVDGHELWWSELLSFPTVD